MREMKQPARFTYWVRSRPAGDSKNQGGQPLRDNTQSFPQGLYMQHRHWNIHNHTHTCLVVLVISINHEDRSDQSSSAQTVAYVFQAAFFHEYCFMDSTT